MLEEITILAFNFGLAGKVVNGPGLSLYNFCNSIKKNADDIKINIFTKLDCREFDPNWNIYSIADEDKLRECIKKSDIVHHWSGLTSQFKEAIKIADSLGRPIVLGPNLIDGVKFADESEFLKDLKFNLIFTVNERLRYLISKLHKIDLDKIKIFMVGPDLDLWSPLKEKTRTILWKGNSQHFVKDIKFGLEVAKHLPRYNFKFMGHPKPYNYFEHIEEAKSCYLYFSTSLSETMGLTMIEAWMAGQPTVSHPKVYLHGENYKTGIITNRDIKSYCQAIEEIMEDNQLYQRLSYGAEDYASLEFSSNTIFSKYLNLVYKLCMSI